MSFSKTYDKGDAVTISAVFKKNGVLIDPDAIYFTYQSPADGPALLQYGVNVAVIKDGIGQYHLDIDANASGLWKYRVHSTGTGQAAAEGKFAVNKSLFD